MRTVRIILYCIILLSLLFAPLQRIEIASLEPIQAVWLYQENEKIILQTDTENIGMGTTIEEALTNMKESSTGIVYLDTAQYVFVSVEAQQQIVMLRSFVKSSVRLCKWEGQGSIQEAVAHADARKIGVKLADWKQGSNLPEIPPLKGKK